MPTPTPPNEKARLRALHELGILDTPPEERFDRLTRLARRLFDVPVCLVSFTDEARRWMKSAEGTELREDPRELAICSLVVLQDEPLVLRDATSDPRFSDNPLVTKEPPVRFYAGAPVRAPNGSPVGTLCVLDHETRDFTEQEHALLLDLAGLVEAEMVATSQATIDPSTGLTNRRGLTTIGQHALALCRRLNRPASVLLLALDGAPEDGAVLHAVGEDLLHTFRDSDVVAHLGGGRFAVLLTGAEPRQLKRPMAILEVRVHARAAQDEWEAPDFTTVAVSYDADVHRTIEDLVDEAAMRLGRG